MMHMKRRSGSSQKRLFAHCQGGDWRILFRYFRTKSLVVPNKIFEKLLLLSTDGSSQKVLFSKVLSPQIVMMCYLSFGQGEGKLRNG